MVVVNRHLDDPEARVLDLLHHLDTDDPARLHEIDALEDRPAHQPKITIDIAQMQPEQWAHDVMVDASDEDAVQRIRATDLIAVDHVHTGTQLRPEHR